ncbi:cytochrome-c peroxidase [soil metagenome]
MKTSIFWFIGLAVLSMAASCAKDEMPLDEPYILNLPAGFPEMPIPTDNALTVKRVELGKLLFFDKALSRDSSLSCGSCHLQANAFSDVLNISPGVEGRKGMRNSPGLFNVGYSPYYFYDGGVPTLELQVLAPVQDVNEMDHDFPFAVTRLAQNPQYQELAEIAYGRTFDAFVLTRALAAFERTLISGNSAYDQYNDGQASALSESAKRGLQLFQSERLSCSGCHSGFNLTDYSFKNNGLYEAYADSGRMRVTTIETDRDKFKVPSLRNVGFTAPYMHDGSFATLPQVVEHYNNGGAANPQKDVRIKPLQLTQQEKTDLLEFLNALSDYEFVTNAKFAE